MIIMSTMKLWALVMVSGLVVACCCSAEETGRKGAADEDQQLVYKNHRTSKNDSAQVARHKYPVYPAQVYANLSNAKDYTTAKTAAQEQPARTTEVPADVVRVFITPVPNAHKRTRAVDSRTSSTVPVPAVSINPPASGAAPSVYFVTSKSVQTAAGENTPSLSQANGGSTRDTAQDSRASLPTVTVDETKRKLKFNGTKIRRVLKAQSQQRAKQAAEQPTPQLLLATSTSTWSPSSPPAQQAFVGSSFVAHSRNITAAGPASTYSVTAKVANSSSASKPFATVLVPKQILEGNNLQIQQDFSSFRPIPAPVYTSYKPAMDTNTIAENRRVSSEAKTQPTAIKVQTGAGKVQTSVSKEQTGVSSSSQKLTKFGVSKQSTYKVEEYVPSDVHPSAVVYEKKFNSFNNKNDRSDQMLFVPAEKPVLQVQQQHQQYQHQQEHQHQHQQHQQEQQHQHQQHQHQQEQQHQHQQHQQLEPVHRYDVPKQNVNSYGFSSVPDSFGVQGQLQFREYYPATEVTPAKDSKYDSAGKFDMRPVFAAAPPTFVMNSRPVMSEPPSSDVKGKQSFEIDSRPPSGPQPKEFSSSGQFTSSRFTSFDAGTESSAPKIDTDNMNPKEMLKSLLLDVLNDKQFRQSETTKKPKLSTLNETVDSYFKISQPDVHYSEDNYNIETDMSCNLRSTKYITDGQCVSSKPVVEAVCADRCLVYASSTSSFDAQRQRSSSSANQQVEALHCVNGESKLVRVQLHCRDGNTLINVIKVVTNCRCKLHKIQPQMRSNSQSRQRGIKIPNTDMMGIAGDTF